MSHQHRNSVTLDVKPLIAALRVSGLVTLDHLQAWCMRPGYLRDERYRQGFNLVPPSKLDGQ